MLLDPAGTDCNCEAPHQTGRYLRIEKQIMSIETLMSLAAFVRAMPLFLDSDEYVIALYQFHTVDACALGAKPRPAIPAVMHSVSTATHQSAFDTLPKSANTLIWAAASVIHPHACARWAHRAWPKFIYRLYRSRGCPMPNVCTRGGLTISKP